MFTQFNILGLETFIGGILHILGAIGLAVAPGFCLIRKKIVVFISFPHYHSKIIFGAFRLLV